MLALFQRQSFQQREKSMRPTLLSIFCLSLTLSSSAQNNEASAKAQERIQKEVRHELGMRPFLDVFDNLGYKGDGSHVTLEGQVTRPTLKTDAERVVKKIEGGETVDNQIEGVPVSPNDDRLRRLLYRAISGY